MSATDTRALRLLAAADRVREAAQECDRADRARAEAWAIHEDTRDVHGQLPLHTPEAASYQRAAVALSAAWKGLAAAREALDAAAREPGDCAWALGVLGAAVRVGEADGVHREERARATSLHYAGRPYDGLMLTEAERASLDAERALLAAARGAR